VLSMRATDVQTPISSIGALGTTSVLAARRAPSAFGPAEPRGYRSAFATGLFGPGAASTGNAFANVAFINKMRPLSPPDHGTG
jgi:hypothetical protein